MARARPSRTAVKVAKGVVFLGGDPVVAPLLPPGAAATSERLVRAAGVMSALELRLYRARWFRWFAHAMERRMMPGQALAGALRKRFFDDEARAAIDAGITQVLVVGAGLDTLCARLAPGLPEVTFVETDTPATIELKRRGLEALELAPPNLHLVGADLAEVPLAAVTDAIAPWRRDAPAIAIAEGVLMYLTASAVDSWFAQVRGIAAPGTRVVFSHMLADERGRVRAGPRPRLTRLLFRMLGEPLRWGLPDGELEAFLRQRGYELAGPAERRDLRRRYLGPAGLDALPLSEVEHLVCAVLCAG